MDKYLSESNPDPAIEPNGENKKFLLEFIETILIAVILFLAINTISARIRIESYSMEPTLFEGDFVLVDKISYRYRNPSRGDVIIFKVPYNPDKAPYIKRIIGLPGETVTVEDGKVKIGGHPLREKYVVRPPEYTGSWVVPKGKIFVLGDNRNNSSDSHSWGFVPLENVIGKAQFVYWPPKEWQILNPSTAYAAGLDP